MFAITRHFPCGNVNSVKVDVRLKAVSHSLGNITLFSLGRSFELSRCEKSHN